MMKKILSAGLLIMIVMPLLAYCVENTESTTNTEKTEKTNTTTQAVKNEKPLYWIDTMEPDVHYSKPGKSRMGMELVPVYPKEKK